MRKLTLLFLLFFHVLFAVDYDCIFIGSSPIPLFEAIYQRYLGKSVLILEQASECGGAWKSIEVCGVPHADLGCHQIGGDRNLKTFLEEYGGCKIVSMDKPDDANNPFSGNGFYFSKGCYELVNNLTQWVGAAGITLLLNHRAESVFIDLAAGHAVVKSEGKKFTTKKIFHSQMTSFHIENNGGSPAAPHKTRYPHLYLLIADPSAPKFSYMGYGGFGASRAMNLTHFVGLTGTGRHLLVFQVSGDDFLNKGQQYLDDLKKRKLVDPSAYILKSEGYVYELSYGSRGGIQAQFAPYFEMLNTGSFAGMSSYIAKWKQALPKFSDAVR
jgi:hypothetical protein